MGGLKSVCVCVVCGNAPNGVFREMPSQGRGGKIKGRESRGGVTRGGGRMKVVDGKGTSSGRRVVGGG